MKRFRIVSLVAVCAATVASATVANAAPAPTPTSKYVVVLKAHGNPASVAAAVAATPSRSFTQGLRGFVANLTATQARSLSARADVAAVAPDTLVATNDTQTSPPSWGLDRIDQRTASLDGTYTYLGTGSGVNAYVIDTGVRTDHVEFTGRLATGYSAVTDGNGSNDCNGHGTHVAGTVAGTTTGVAKAATVIPVRVLDCAGSGTAAGVVAGIDWVIAHHQPGVPAVANLSLGGGANTAIDTAVANLVADGVTVVVAAGNNNANACNYSPARVASAVTVAATTSTDARASYSNYGSCLDMFAPGSSITSAWYTGSTASASLSGTSMASPHVAGIAALYLGANPGATPSTVTAALVANTTTGVVTGAGTGSPNRLAFHGAAPVAPSAPTGVTATAGRRSAKLAWTAAANGGSTLTANVIDVYTGGRKVSSVTVTGTATTATVGSLTAGATYTFTVTAKNAVGSSAPSVPSNPVVPTR